MSNINSETQEMNFLIELASILSEKTGKNLEFYIHGVEGIDEFFFQLGFADTIELTANYGKNKIVFPLQIQMNINSDFSLSLKTPDIFEIGDKLRLWRLIDDPSLQILDENGDQLHCKIKNVSATGISLIVSKEKGSQYFKEHLDNVYLKLPNKKSMKISGKLCQRVDDNTLAYCLEHETEKDILATLTEYLFECYIRQNPNLKIPLMV